MAKRRSSGTSAFNQFVAATPRECRFEITMAVDSTTEVWTDIDTNLDDGEAWTIYGLEWDLEGIDPTVPVPIPNQTADSKAVLQIHRNDDHELLISANDDDLLMYDSLTTMVATAVAANIYRSAPWRRERQTITMQPTLRAIFRTSADDAQFNGTTNQLACCLYYDVVKAPTVTNSKLGQWGNL